MWNKQQLEQTILTIKSFKEMMNEKGSKEAVINHLMSETGLTKEECESAYDVYNGISESDIEKAVESL